MCGIINATPALRFFDEIHGTLHAYGYDSKMYSLYKVRPPKGPWSMGPVSYTHLTLPTIYSV